MLAGNQQIFFFCNISFNSLSLFVTFIADIRRREKGIIAKSLIVQSLSSALPQAVLVCASAFTFLAMTGSGVGITSTEVCF